MIASRSNPSPSFSRSFDFSAELCLAGLSSAILGIGTVDEALPREASAELLDVDVTFAAGAFCSSFFDVGLAEEGCGVFTLPSSATAAPASSASSASTTSKSAEADSSESVSSFTTSSLSLPASTFSFLAFAGLGSSELALLASLASSGWSSGLACSSGSTDDFLSSTSGFSFSISVHNVRTLLRSKSVDN